jgi:hypothetical protein
LIASDGLHVRACRYAQAVLQEAVGGGGVRIPSNHAAREWWSDEAVLAMHAYRYPPHGTPHGYQALVAVAYQATTTRAPGRLYKVAQDSNLDKLLPPSSECGSGPPDEELGSDRPTRLPLPGPLVAMHAYR